MFGKIKVRAALSVITAIIAVTCALGLGMGSAAHRAQTATVKTASVTDVSSLLKAQVAHYTIMNAWPKKYTGV